MHIRHTTRRGAILIMTAFCLILLLGFVALAIDLGLLLVARGQCQNAADAAAMAAARTLTGNVNQQDSQATAQALLTASKNYAVGKPIDTNQITVGLGSYYYDTGKGKFLIAVPKNAGDIYNLARVHVQANPSAFFGRVLGLTSFTVSAQATSVHRPRDIGVALDFSGSMRFDSLLGIPYNGNRTMSNNPESVFPQFGHYSDVKAAALQNTKAATTINGDVYGSANITVATPSGDPIVKDFFQNSKGAAAVLAFTADPAKVPDTYATSPGGDNFPLKKGSTSYAKTVEEMTGSTSRDANFEKDGYGANFKGWTQGPRYWGKTFFMWPPDPRPTFDWRQKFFSVNDNTDLWESDGDWKAPSDATYLINYTAVLQWLHENCIQAAPGDGKPFPPRLRAGRILYYDAVPTSIDNSKFPPTDLNERFWKEYIDYVLGVEQTGGSVSDPNYDVIIPQTGYGDDYTWSNVKISAKPTSAPYGNINKSGGYAKGYAGAITLKSLVKTPAVGDIIQIGSDKTTYQVVSATSNSVTLHQKLAAAAANSTAVTTTAPYMNYQDNPRRPKLHFWFGPMTMVDFLGNYNTGQFWWPGTCHESPAWQLKVGIQAALHDIQRNHPSDYISLAMFSVPENSKGSPTDGRFNQIRVPLGRNYSQLEDALWYPPATLADPTLEIRPYDKVNNEEVPRAMGGTCPAMGLMQVYNQFNSSQSLQTYAKPDGLAGGFGRIGAQKLIILETDGMATTPASATLTNSGANKSYYNIRPGEYPKESGTVDTQIYGIASQLAALETASPPGYGTARKKTLIHCLGFGTVFEATNFSSDKTAALTLLQNIQFRGNTQASASTPLDSYKMIVGTSQQRIDRLQQAFQTIMQDSVQVTLIE